MPPRAGYENQVAIRAVDIETDPQTKAIQAEKRNCFFNDEFKLKMHENYTQAFL